MRKPIGIIFTLLSVSASLSAAESKEPKELNPSVQNASSAGDHGAVIVKKKVVALPGAEVKVVKLHTEKGADGNIHWMPATVEINPGEKIKFVVTHATPGGFDFHGFKIPVLGIEKQVNRGKDLVVDVSVPADVKAGEYEIGCQFHPKHQPAKLLVK